MTERTKQIFDVLLGGTGIGSGAAMADWTGAFFFALGSILLLSRIARHLQHIYHQHHGFSRGTDQSADQEGQ